MTRDTDDLELTERPEGEEDLEDLALEENYELNPDYVPLVVDALDRGDSERLRELLGALHPADIADLMGFLSTDDREELAPQLDPEVLGEVLAELDTEIREDILEHLPSAVLAKALGEMESDDAADVVDDLEDDKRAQVLAAMPEIERVAIETTLAYEDETAGRLMQREVVAAPQFWTVGHAIDYLRREGEELPELFFDVYVVDPAYKPVGACPVSHLLRAQRDTHIHPNRLPDFASVQLKWAEVEKEQLAFVSHVTDEGLKTKLPARGMPLELVHLMQHMVNHSTYHRGQISLMMRQLNAEPVATDFHVFLTEGA